MSQQLQPIPGATLIKVLGIILTIVGIVGWLGQIGHSLVNTPPPPLVLHQPEPPPPPPEPPPNFHRIDELFKVAQYDKYCMEFETLAAHTTFAPPVDVYVRYIAASTYLRNGKTAGTSADRCFDLFGQNVAVNRNPNWSLYAALFGYEGYRQAGEDTAANKLIDKAAAMGNNTQWPYPIISYLHGDIDAARLFSQAGNDQGRWTDAKTFVGIKHLYDKDNEKAMADFAWVVERGNRDYLEYALVISEIRFAENPQLTGQALIPTQTDKNHAQNGYSQAELFWKTAVYSNVCEEFERAFALYPVPPHETLSRYVIACTCIRRGERAAAFAKFWLGGFGWDTEESPYLILYGYTGYLQAGKPQAAQELLVKSVEKCDPNRFWPYTLIVCLEGKMSLQTVFSQISNNRSWMTEAKTFIGVQQRYNNRQAEAITNFLWVKQNGDKNRYVYILAMSELERTMQP